MRASLAAISVVAVLAAIGGCGSGDDGMTQAKAAAAVKAGAADAAELLGAGWETPASPPVADAMIAERCGDPSAGLGIPGAGLVDTATSSVLAGDPESGASTPPSAHVRTGVVAYENEARATDAYLRISGFAALEQCMVAAVTGYVRADHPDRSAVPDPSSGSFDLRSREVSAGDAATILQSAFDEGVLGGFDNTHNTALFVTQSGALVVTAIAATSSQQADQERAATLARRLGTSALERATAAPS